MFLESAEAIRAAIGRLITEHGSDEPILAAVAFWGTGAEGVLGEGKRYRLICNLAMGGTNPAVIEALGARPEVALRHLPNLHAKVVASSAGAVVSSANFSAGGLALEGMDSAWREAGFLIEAGHPEFFRVVGWFEGRWREAAPVDAAALEHARRVWQPGEASGEILVAATDETRESTVAGQSDAAVPAEPPTLAELDLFELKKKPRNPLRMAADWLVDEYRRMRGGELSNTDRYVPAYVAYVIWTQAGKRMATAIKGTPEFSRPEQVLRRAEELGGEYPDRVRNLIGRLARGGGAVPPAAAYWARHWLERNP